MASKKTAAPKKGTIRIEKETINRKILIVDGGKYILKTMDLTEFNDHLPDGYIFTEGSPIEELIQQAQSKNELLQILRGLIELVEQVK